MSVNSFFNLTRSSRGSCKDTHGSSLLFESSQILSTCFFSLDCMFFVFFLVFFFIFSSFLHLLPSACVLGLAGCSALKFLTFFRSFNKFIIIHTSYFNFRFCTHSAWDLGGVTAIFYCNEWHPGTLGEANCHAAKTTCGGESSCELVYFTSQLWINCDHETRS